MAYRYKNVSDSVQTVPGVGEFQPGETRESEVKIENSNFQLIDGQLPHSEAEKPKKKEVSPTLPKSD